MTPATDRTLGPWRCWALVVGGTIGSAIFMMPAILAPFGGLGVVSLAAAAFGALSVAIMLGNLSRRVTTTGGPYAYARAGFGDFGGFLIAWGYWISQWTACAGLVIAFTAYVGEMIPAIGANPWLSMGTGLALTWSFVAINIAGVRESGIVGLATTIIKLVPLVIIGTVGFLFVRVNRLPSMNPSADSAVYVFATAFALTFWNFVGIESASVPAENVVNPTTTIARALVTGTLTVALVNLLVAFSVMGMIAPDQLAASASPAFLICMWVIAAGGEESVYWVFLLLMAGIPIYVFVTRTRNIEDSAHKRSV